MMGVITKAEVIGVFAQSIMAFGPVSSSPITSTWELKVMPMLLAPEYVPFFNVSVTESVCDTRYSLSKKNVLCDSW